MENELIKCFFERHGDSFKSYDGPHALRAIAYARIVACQMMLQDKDLYKIGGKLDTTACRLCVKINDRTDQGERLGFATKNKSPQKTFILHL